jgi:hypothetical protein
MAQNWQSYIIKGVRGGKIQGGEQRKKRE